MGEGGRRAFAQTWFVLCREKPCDRSDDEEECGDDDRADGGAWGPGDRARLLETPTTAQSQA